MRLLTTLIQLGFTSNCWTGTFSERLSLARGSLGRYPGAMRIIRTYSDTSSKPQLNAVAAIGNFDGVHLGHQSLIDSARFAAEAAGAPLGIVTFEPHPRELFSPNAPAFRLMNAAAKANRLEKIGVDILFEIPFDETLAGLSAEGFAKQVIVDGLGLRHVFVGADFCFGKGRSGSTDDLMHLGTNLGFQTSVQPLIHYAGQDVSSTRIRNALSQGKPREATAMLGHYHRIDGPVIKGDQRGRDLGYPTANMSIERLHQPRFGVYAVLVDVLSGPHAGSYTGVASLGVRPMFGKNTPNLETHVFDFTGDLYGERLSVGLVEFLRDEQKFSSVDALVAQMSDDAAAAREITDD